MYGGRLSIDLDKDVIPKNVNFKKFNRVRGSSLRLSSYFIWR